MVYTGFKAVFFDLDQTLVDTLKRFFKVFNNLISDLGGEPINWSLFLKHYAADTLDLFIPSSVNRDFFWKTFLMAYNSVSDSSDRLFPDAPMVLSCLRSVGFRIVVLTGRAVDEALIWDELKRFNIAHYVDAVFTCKGSLGDVLFSKVEIIHKACSQLDISPSEVILVGDYWADVESGKKAGVGLVVGVLTGLLSKDVLKSYGADVVLESVSHLPSLLGLSSNCAN